MRHLLFLLALAASLAQAASNNDKHSNDAEDATIPPGAVQQDWDWVVLPAPRADPTFGVGLTLSALLITPNPDGGNTGKTGAFGMGTSNGSYAGGLFHKSDHFNNKWRFMAGAIAASLKMDFYGVGESAGSQNISVPVVQDVRALMGGAQYAVAKNWWVGGLFTYAQVNAEFDLPTLPPPYPTLPPTYTMDNSMPAVGIKADYDSRDNDLNPSRGGWLSLMSSSAREHAGSDNDYDQINFSANYYLPLREEKDTLAMRATWCNTSKDPRFYQLCSYGQQKDLRGYASDQYRDRDMATIQAEYRWRFGQRWGAVAFAGTGAVAPSAGDLRLVGSESLPAAGVGLRFLAATKQRVNVSVDYAVGKDGSEGWYFYIGEAY